MTTYQAHSVACWTCRETENRCDDGRVAFRRSAGPPLTETEEDLARGALAGRVALSSLGLYDRLYQWFQEEGHMPDDVARAKDGTDQEAWIIQNLERYL